MPLARAAAAGVSLVAVTLLALFLRRTSLGQAIRAAANNREGAALVGVDVKRVYLVSFSLGTVAANSSSDVLTS